MENLRKPFQGVANIIRFNWHFYVIAFGAILFFVLISSYFGSALQFYIYIFCFLAATSTFISLLVSYYVYDISGLYRFDWIKKNDSKISIVNIHAGFDETSCILHQKFKNAQLTVLDFYDPEKHTEISIKRARKAYPPYPETKSIETFDLQLPNASIDKIFLIFAAHEIRNEAERQAFFNELKRILKPEGEIFIMEHLRDFANFLAYNIGFLHFYNKNTWLKTFEKTDFTIKIEIKFTPFVSTFILMKNGVAH